MTVKMIIHAAWCARYKDDHAKCDCGSFERMVDIKRKARMDQIDRQSPEMRALVHEYGWNIVKSFIDIGVTQPNHVRHLVETVLNEFSPTRSTFSNQGVSNDIAINMTERHLAKQKDPAA